ncbi:DUF4139 domain-containing protein [Streptomyces sp. NPDC046939]|uniref:DUF4139 domain-containing protein n=1 Tax=Streptomyces sp. NPDC046939 TaxID=3155376 RepID=UPI00340A3506
MTDTRTGTEAARAWGSTLTSVVVYAQGAVCVRRARGVVTADGGRVRVGGLPLSLEPSSLRAAVVDAPGVRVAEARFAVEAEPSASDTDEELYREVERLTEAWRAAEARRDRQRRRIEEVAAVRPVQPPRRRDDPHRRTPVDAWLGLADFVDERLAALHAELDERDEELRRVAHELDLATERLHHAPTDAAPDPVRVSASALLTLEGTAGDEITVDVEYRVPGAVWAPSYRLTHPQGEGGGRLVLRASVAQHTGEDWTGVRVGLSTADLLRPTGLPRLRSTRIGRRQPPPAPSGWREPPAGLSELFAGHDAAGPRPVSRTSSAGAAGSAPAPAPAPQLYGFAEEEPSYDVAPPPGTGEAPVYGAPPPAPAAPGSVRPRSVGKARAGAPLFADAPMASGAAPAPPPPAPPRFGPPRPSAAELDYGDLVLAGADAPDGRRGLLAPGTPENPAAAGDRERAASVRFLPLPGHAVPPRVSAGSFDHRYDAEGPADIPSDGTWHTVTVTELPVGLRTEYVCVPSVEETVYATLVLTNETDRALLAGPVDLTSDGDQLPTTALPTIAPGGTGRIGLGPAEAIRVSRRTELRESTAGLRNTTTVLDHRVHVELANRLPRTVTVEVRERVPVTSEGDIRIEEHGGWTAPPDGGDGPERPVPGTRLWRVDVPAGGTAVLDGGHEIRLPAAKALVGGERRS